MDDGRDEVEAVKAALGGVRVASASHTPVSGHPSPALRPPSSASSPYLKPSLKQSPADPSATLDALFSPQSPRRSPPCVKFDLGSPEPEPEAEAEPESSGIVSRASSAGPSRRKKEAPPPPTLIPDLPLAWDDALASFDSLERCVYERKDLGLSREQDDMMVCDCTFNPNDPSGACGHDSDCINRAIFIECLPKECRTGKHCLNQRLNRRQYAPVDIVLTEKKGFGLRAREDLPAGSLIYEYIGEVVVEKTFRERMAAYAAEGIKHFYFMMLQKEEYIDATKKGGIGRFANHSCNPNCEVQKWVVGRRMRMGIYAKRDVLKDEEITFNYNVDRYGHTAQPCYCGEYNCVGTIGGKTQTDVGGMDDLLLDALGILDDVTAGGMKGSKKKKSRQLDVDYNPILRPIEPPEAPKVSAAIRQSLENPPMLSKLLDRVGMTDEPAVHRQLMRLHGFGLMTIILTDQAQDRNMVSLALECLEKFKSTMTYRNKVEDSGIEDLVKVLADGEDEQIATIAKDLLAFWSTLEMSYRIPRVQKLESLDEEDNQNTTTIADHDAMPRRHFHVDDFINTQTITFKAAPVRQASFAPPARHRPPPPPPLPKPVVPSHAAERSKLDAIIAMAAASAQPIAAPPPVETPTPARVEEPRKRQKTAHNFTPEDEAKKEKRLTKLVGEVVVKSMSKYKDQMDHDTFKRYAKDCTNLLVDKEKRGRSYQNHRHPQLSEEKKAKMKSFTKDYVHKLLRNLKAKGKLRRTTSSTSTQARDHSPNTPAMTPSRMGITPWDTPAKGESSAASATASTPHGSVNGDALLDEMFGEDDMDLDEGGAPSLAPDATPSTSTHYVGTPLGSTPPPSSPHVNGNMSAPSRVGDKPVVVDHANGPFLSRGPVLVDRFEGFKSSRRPS
ncbi:hypothetical protein CC85DRAFT_283658 [Cutaneotrichosporon oleaginosum]|uniref:Histone-lysine N-methyltransferase, H3 lysine-36 specific n=1 Tax=Cutaneotrichosporon oleaginosum TaxID=879819 RepID=A0A0J0XTM4_9TREE|nr:uncharacterized protein CC85DRAFT_283658 [Cutaneotrichosporon oleaginosum]KLT44431.1 hypothetical protein CC85DRAFT_283658 [Cutaneotrichosporon oleaginosum]TXT07849.1 hypothetical protein COLE_04773 [Cutaneotrichosporon oleaginosum]